MHYSVIPGFGGELLPPGVLVDAGGYPMHMIVAGAEPEPGTPTVVLEAGLATDALIWCLVQPEVARFARVIAYDRAGLGWSAPRRTPRTPEHIAAELEQLLHFAGENGPYVLVGHAMGGIYARAFAARAFAAGSASQVAGLVLLDSPHEEMNLRLPVDVLAADQELVQSFSRQLRELAEMSHAEIVARQRAMRPAHYVSPFPPEVEELRQDRARPYVFEASLRELAAVEATLSRPLDRSYSLGDRPVAILIAGEMQQHPGLTPEQNRQADEVARTLQWELAALSRNSRVETVAGCGHLIQVQRPEVVVAAIRWVLNLAGIT